MPEHKTEKGFERGHNQFASPDDSEILNGAESALAANDAGQESSPFGVAPIEQPNE